MKKLSVSLAVFCLFMSALTAFAQTADYTGNWELDLAKSKLPERMRIESMTLNVAQTDKELKIETLVKRAPRPEGETPGVGISGMRQGGAGRGGMMNGGNGILVYKLDGKEQTLEVEAYNAMPPTEQPKTESMTLQAKIESGGKLKLVSSRSFETPNGSMSVKTTETWELVDGGKALKVMRDAETPRGTQTAEMYFTKKALSGIRTVIAAPMSSDTDMAGVYQGKVITTENNTSGSPNQTIKTISGGVINGKALALPRPEYPAAAKAVRATGAVNVQVTFDEQGNVISASAVSGHPLLRQAAEQAARKAKFAPVLLSGIPVKVTGIIVYNFTR